MANKDAKPIPNGLKFLFGGSAGMLATVFVHPMDLIKNRMQLSKGKQTSFQAFKDVVAKEGFLALYNGISAGLLRQATYTTTRLGTFNWLLELLKSPDGQPPGFATKAAVGMVSGVCGAFVGNPAEVALIRMTADGRLPPAERSNYKNVLHALLKIHQEGGTAALWRGAVPTMARAMVVNAAQLATYSQAKQRLENMGFSQGVLLHFIASMVSGLVTAAASMPVDIVKTRIQNQKSGGAKAGPVDILVNIVKSEGVFALWKGFMPYYFRVGPHTVLTFIFLEQINTAYYKYA